MAKRECENYLNPVHIFGGLYFVGTYEASTKTFTPNEGVEVEEGYVKAVNRLVQAKYSYAKQIIQQDYYAIVIGDPNP